MSFSIQISDAYGFHTYNQLEGILKTIGESIELRPNQLAEMEEGLPKFQLAKNLLTIAGYIPVIGTIVGIAKLILIDKHEKNIDEYVMKNPKILKIKSEIQEYNTGQKIRSWIEVTSLGFFLLIPDLIFTIGRNISKNPVEAL